MSISSDTAWHCATLGVFLTDQDHHVYAVTCKHFTEFPNDGKIYFETPAGKREPFGTILGKNSSGSGRALCDFNFDIDVIKVESDYKDFCTNWSSTLLKSYISVDVFEGRVDCLYGSAFSSLSNGEVVIPVERNFRRTDNDINETSNSLVSEMLSINIQDCRSDMSEVQVKEDSLKAFTCIAGHVESQYVHVTEKFNLPECSILVRCCNTKFKPGDSGTVIACIDEGKLVLVGVLTGLFKSELTGKSYITCQEFRKSLDTLEEIYEKKFFLHHDSNQQLKSRSSEGHHIMSGSVILIKSVDVSVKSPEDIAEIDYEFVNVILCLIDNMKDDCMSSGDIEQEVQSEKRLSICVSARGELESPENICTSPAVTCYYLCMKGCSFLYQGKFEESTEELKAATKMIIKLPCRNRMLCRLITYTTWTLLKTGRLKEMEEVLLEAEPYITSMKEQAVCPNSSVGYYYFDYARYYVPHGDYHKALEKANAALAHFRQGGKPSVGKILSLAMIARLYLNCGENFERRNSTIVKSQLNEARELLNEAKELSSQTATEEVTVLLTEIDLYYRAGNNKKALETTKKCLNLARENDLEEERGRAEIRFKELTKYSRTLMARTPLEP